MPARISEEILGKVKEIWAEDRDRSGREIHQLYHQRFGGDISERRVQQAVKQWVGNAPQEPFPLAEWIPWDNESESPEDSAFLLSLLAQSVQINQRGLYQHEARWGCRLRVALEGLNPIDQLCIIRGYARRELIGYHLREKPYTAHLDGIVAYRAWSPEATHKYAHAVANRHVPLPIPVHSQPAGYSEVVKVVNDYLDTRGTPASLPVEDSDIHRFTFRLLTQVLEVWDQLHEDLDSV